MYNIVYHHILNFLRFRRQWQLPQPNKITHVYEVGEADTDLICDIIGIEHKKIWN